MNVILVTHATEIFGPPHALLNYLRPRTETLVFISYPLDKSIDLEPSALLYRNGKFVCKKLLPPLLQRFAISYLRDFVATFYFVILLKDKIKIDYFIGANNLNCLAGLLLKPLLKIKTVVFYTVDYSLQRFDNKFLDWLYHLIDKLAARKANFVWSNTQRVAQIREKQGVADKRNLVVPNGVDLSSISLPPYGSLPSNTIVFIGHLTEGKGIRNILEILPEVVNRMNNLKFVIIGSGPFEGKLKQKVKSKNLEKNVEFLGKLNHTQVIKILPKYKIGVALYTMDEAHNYYCDPIKVKEFLACGLPVIVSDIPEVAIQVTREKAGFAVNLREDFKNAILKLLTDGKLYKQYRENGLKLARKYDWDEIFEKAFAKMETL